MALSNSQLNFPKLFQYRKINMATLIPSKYSRETKQTLIQKIIELESCLALNKAELKLEKFLVSKKETELQRAKEEQEGIEKVTESWENAVHELKEQRDALSIETTRLRGILKLNGVHPEETVVNIFKFNESRAFGYTFLTLQLLSLIGIILIAVR